jgi:hypothetical protein
LLHWVELLKPIAMLCLPALAKLSRHRRLSFIVGGVR